MNYFKIIYKIARVALLLFFLIGMGMIFVPQFQQYQALKRREEALTEEIRAEEEMIKRLKHWQERFPEDRRFVKQIAHDLGMAQSNEIVFTFVDDDYASPAAP